MTPEEAVPRINDVLAHLWMVRRFLKHAEEIEDDADFLAVPRLIYDSIRAAEPARERGDTAEFLRRIKGKLGKLRANAEWFAAEYPNVSSHTNFEMASQSYLASVRQLEEIFDQIQSEG